MARPRPRLFARGRVIFPARRGTKGAENGGDESASSRSLLREIGPEQ